MDDSHPDIVYHRSQNNYPQYYFDWFLHIPNLFLILVLIDYHFIKKKYQRDFRLCDKRFHCSWRQLREPANTPEPTRQLHC